MAPNHASAVSVIASANALPPLDNPAEIHSPQPIPLDSEVRVRRRDIPFELRENLHEIVVRHVDLPRLKL